MTHQLAMVRAFHEKHGLLRGDFQTMDDALTRARLIVEESAEVVAALHEDNREKLADGLADLAYVTYGTAIAYHVPLEAAFLEVHRSNMSKGPLEEGRKGGKRHPGFFHPDILEVLRINAAARHGTSEAFIERLR